MRGDTDRFLTDKRTNLFIILMGIFLTNAIVAEIVGAKIFSLEATFGLSPVSLPLFGERYSFDLTAGVVLWPVVFVTTDIINEYFGKAGVRKASLMAVGLIAYMFVLIWVVADLPPAAFWTSQYAEEGIDINRSFALIFQQGMGIIIGSLVAFLIGQFADVTVFQWLRKRTGSGRIWLRATGSTLVSQFVDSFVVLFVAFYVFGRPKPWPLDQVIAVGVVNYIYKFVVAIALTPALYLAHYAIDSYLGKDYAGRLADQASDSTFF